LVYKYKVNYNLERKEYHGRVKHAKVEEQNEIQNSILSVDSTALSTLLPIFQFYDASIRNFVLPLFQIIRRFGFSRYIALTMYPDIVYI